MRQGNEIRLYNLIFPLWLIIWWPSLLWLLIIPLNYGLDFLVTYLCTKDVPEHGKFCRKYVWKICLAGFLADLAGVALMLIITLGGSAAGADRIAWLDDITGAVMMNPFTHPVSLIIVLLIIALCAFLIFVLDRKILMKTGLTAEKARYIALRLAIFTAPYVFLFPSSLLYTEL